MARVLPVCLLDVCLLDRSRAIRSAICLLLLTAAGWAADRIPVTIRIVNSAKVAHTTLDPAEHEATLVLKQAGVDAVWKDCSRIACPADLTPGEFWVHVATWKPLTTSADVLGFTAAGDSDSGSVLAGVYYPMVREMAEVQGLEEPDILGAVMAHEIGHLLGLAHSAAGIMSPALTRAKIISMHKGELQFDGSEANRMRSEVLRAAAGRARPPA